MVQEDNQFRLRQAVHSLDKGLLRLAILASVAISLLVVFQQTVSANALAVVHGDVNCSGTADTIDALQVVRSVAGVTASTECAAETGDVNCDDAMNAADSLDILRYVADDLQALEGCSPRALAARLYATTDNAEAEALLLRHVYSEVGVGVYTGDGQQILAGSETGPDDFYLYDFESELLVRNYVERQVFGLETLTLFLDEAGVVDEDSGQPLTDAGVLSVLAAKVTAARGDESMFTWRLIDELGLAQEDPLDLTDPTLDPAATYLDSVQTFLALYDMTLGLPVSAGVSDEVFGAADGPNARTQALHDYSLLANAYGLYNLPVEPTHWKHPQDQGSDRKVEMVLYFLPGERVAQGVTTGPLRNVALPREGGVPGAVVNWFPDASLVPRNGTMTQLESSRTTNSDGHAHDFFIPKRECPTRAGVGQVVDEVGKLQVVARVQVTSVFPPHSPLGVISKLDPININVSHHAGAAAQAAGGVSIEGAVSIQAITSLDELPCEWTGTGHASIHHSLGTWDETGEISGTVTFGNPQLAGNTVTYEVTSGSSTWQGSEVMPAICSFSGSGTYDSAQGSLIVTDNGSGQLTYSGLASGSFGDPEPGACFGLFDLDNGPFFHTCSGNQPLTDLILSDSCDVDEPLGYDDQYEWTLNGICPGAASVTPQDGGTCGPNPTPVP